MPTCEYFTLGLVKFRAANDFVWKPIFTVTQWLIFQVFEKWKQDQEEVLKGRIRKQTQTENKLKQEKQMEKEDRKKDASAAFSKW